MIEVMASMMLVAIVLPVAMKGVSLALQTASLARQRSLAASLAETQMSDLITTNDWDQSSMQGKFDDNPAYSWTADLTQWEGSTVQQLEVKVLWTARGQERSVTLDTLIYTSPQTETSSTGGTATP
jgi:type II secretory pathway pseudopilin PulG